MRMKLLLVIMFLGLGAAATGCSEREETASAAPAKAAEADAAPITNRIPIPQAVRDNLGIEERMPPETHVEIAPITGITGEIMLLSLSSPDGRATDLALRDYAEYELRSRLLAVPGIAQVSVIGGELPEYSVNVRQDRLMLHGLSMQDVVDAAAQAHSTASAGYLSNVRGLELPMRQTARVRSVEDIESTVVTYQSGSPVIIGQVAEVVLSGAPKRGTGAEGAKPAVVLALQKAPGTNTLAITEAVDQLLDGVEATLPEGMVLNREVMRQTTFINLSLRNVLVVLRDASIFVAIVLVLFLLNVRTTLITLTALPLSLAVALLILWGWGLTINVMTLGGLAVAIGELVDDAIIDVENVFRRLRENSLLPADQQKSFLRLIYDASNEIRSSVVFATVIIVIVFVPLLFLQGMEGRFFRPLGIAYITSILASLIVALTVTPALCAYLLRGKLGHAEKEGFLVRWLKAGYEPVLRASIAWRKTVIATALLMTVGSILLARTFGTSFLPEFNEGSFTIFLMAPPGTSLEESNRLATNVERRLVQVEGVKNVVRRTGRAERDAHAEPVSNSELDVAVKPGFRKEDVRREIDKVLAGAVGLTTMVGQPIEHRLSHILSGTPAAIAIDVFGDDLSKLRKIAKEIEAELKKLPGTRDVAANREVLITSLPIRYRSAELQRFGLTPAGAAGQVQAALYGEVVAEVNEGVRRYDIAVRLAPDERATVEQIRKLILRGSGGALVRLEEIADIGPETASNLIARENARRKAVISCNVAEGANLGDLVEQVKARVEPVVHRYGYVATYGGQFEAQQSASRTIYLMGGFVCIIILLLLNMALGSFRAATLVMVNLPLALIGGIIAVFVTESPNVFGNALALFGIGRSQYIPPVISIASMVGFVTLFGIAVRNGILLVNHYNYLMNEESKSVTDAVVQGSMERLVPILMTALTAVLGLVPLALAAGEPGSELLAPLAIVVLGGLITSTLLNVVVVPGGYALIFSGRSAKPAAEPARDFDGAVAVAPANTLSLP